MKIGERRTCTCTNDKNTSNVHCGRTELFKNKTKMDFYKDIFSTKQLIDFCYIIRFVHNDRCLDKRVDRRIVFDTLHCVC